MKAFAGLYCITWGYDQKAESRIQKVEDDSFLHSLFLVVVVCGCIPVLKEWINRIKRGKVVYVDTVLVRYAWTLHSRSDTVWRSFRLTDFYPQNCNDWLIDSSWISQSWPCIIHHTSYPWYVDLALWTLIVFGIIEGIGKNGIKLNDVPERA